MDEQIKAAVLTLVDRSVYGKRPPSEVADLAKAALDLAQTGRVLAIAETEAESSSQDKSGRLGFARPLPRETP